MTHLSSTDLRPQAPARRSAGRPALFALMLVLAAIAVFTVLLAGPALPVGTAVALSATALLLVVTGWITAGPRW